MALRGPRNTPAFESDDTQAAPAAEPVAQPTVEQQAAAGVAATTAIAKAATGTVVVKAGPVKSSISQFEWAIGPDDLEAIGFGVFPRITCDTGGFARNKTEALGGKIGFKLVSWNPVWIVTTGEDGDEANKLVRTSYDGVNLTGGQGLVTDYVKYLKEVEKYEDTKAKQYVEIYAHLIYTEKLGDISEEDAPLVQISLSPQSVGQWKAFLLQTGLKEAQGKLQVGDVIYASQERRTVGRNTFGVATFSLKK